MSGVGLLISRLRVREAGSRIFNLHFVAARPAIRTILSQNNVLRLSGTRSVTTKSTKTTSARKAPAAKKPAAKKTTTKKPAAKKSATKKTTTAKGKKTAKKTATKKPVKRKAAKPRTLTEEEKLRKRERAQKTKLATKKAELKATILDPPSSKPDVHTSGYNIFLAEQMKGKTNIDFKALHSNSGWASMSEADKQKYNDIAKTKKEATKAAYIAFIERHAPSQIRAANSARRALKKLEPTRSYPPLVDHRLPKRPLPAFLQFFTEFNQSPEAAAIASIGERAKQASAKWNRMSEAEKRPYQMAFDSDKRRYDQQYAALA